MKKLRSSWPASITLLIAFSMLGLISLNARMPLQSFWTQDLPIESIRCLEEDGSLMIELLGCGYFSYYWRGLNSAVVEKRSDGQPHTSVKLSFSGVTLLVPVDEDVVAWREAIQKAKTEYAAYLESSQPKRVLPSKY